MPKRSRGPADRNCAVTFNVLFMPGSVARLLPMSLSLLQSPRIRVRFVANGCDPAEVELLRAVAETEERASEHALPNQHPIEHGRALNVLFEAFPEPHFAFVDSDIVATGDFMGSLWPLGPHQAGAFTAPPVWVADHETVSAPNARTLSGRRRTLHDGSPVGGTYCAIYDRAALEPLWRDAPRGFAVHHRHALPRGMRASLSARGWLYRTFDTGRLLNLQLLIAGFELENRRVPELHHLGGFSARRYEGVRGGARSLLALLRSGSDGRWRRLVDGGQTRLFARTPDDPTRRARSERRRVVLSYLDGVLDAIRAAEPPPAAPRTDSAEVDERVAALVAALRSQYPRGLATMREVAPQLTSAGAR